MGRGVAVAAATGFAAVALGAGTASAAATTGCAGQVFEKPFTRWLDSANYVLAPGGTFEGALPGWKLSGGAAVVKGNETFNVHGAGESHSLSLPAGSSVTTAPICITLAHPDLRLFVRNSGFAVSTLAVQVVFPTILGPVSLPIGVAVAGSSWTPTLPLPILVNATALLSPDGTIPVSFKFTPLLGGNWQIDDLYVDPYKMR